MFPTPEFDPGIHPHYQEFFESGRISRIYLLINLLWSKLPRMSRKEIEKKNEPQAHFTAICLSTNLFVHSCTLSFSG